MTQPAPADRLIDSPRDDGARGSSAYVRRLTGAALLKVPEKTINRYRQPRIVEGETLPPLLTTFRNAARPFEVWLSRTELQRLKRAMTKVSGGPANTRAARLAAEMERLALLELAREHQNT